MAITTYAALQSAINEHLARSDLAAQVPEFISRAEARLNRVLRAREMQAEASIVLASGAAPLPADYLEWISATWTGARTIGVRYVEPNSDEWQRRYRPFDDPQLFTILAGSAQIRPAADGSLVLSYYQAIPDLASNNTNWLLAKAPDIYLYTALAEAASFIKDDERMANYLGLALGDAQKMGLSADAVKAAHQAAPDA